jgi:C4-dicarboxylate-specific signal transduction histidine kinase
MYVATPSHPPHGQPAAGPHGLDVELHQARCMGITGRLAAGIAHDINNSLMAIAGYATLARLRQAPADEMNLLLKQIEDAALDAGTVANAVLAFTHQLPTDPGPVELRATVERVARLLRRL